MVEPGLQPHPILPLLLAAAGGTFPAVDGQGVLLPPLEADLQAVVSFTGHAVVASALPESDFADPDLDGFGSALHPAALQHLAGRHGHVGVIDVTLAAHGSGEALSLSAATSTTIHASATLGRCASRCGCTAMNAAW